ncbi:hypothetical protein ABPG75_003546 [Micractinium tetrahymenae]
MTSLRSLLWLSCWGCRPPLGPCFGGLRRFAASFGVVAALAPALAAAAPRLEFLGVYIFPSIWVPQLPGNPGPPAGEFASLLRRIPDLKGLRRLLLAGNALAFQHFWLELEELQNASPQLQIDQLTAWQLSWPVFFRLCGCEGRPDLSRSAFLAAE